MDQLAPVHAFPVLREEFSISTGFHDPVALLAAHEAFHQAGLFIDKFHRMLFLRHPLTCRTAGIIKAWKEITGRLIMAA